MDDGNLAGRYPAIVRSYDQNRRTCRVEIPAINSGGDVLAEAEIEYPIGDKSRRAGPWFTEIEILPGDTVWVAFIGGDARYPIITGYRNPLAGNSVDWRRYHHKNYDIETDDLYLTKAGQDYRIAVHNRGQIITKGRLLLQSQSEQVIIKSAAGTHVF